MLFARTCPGCVQEHPEFVVTWRYFRCSVLAICSLERAGEALFIWPLVEWRNSESSNDRRLLSICQSPEMPAYDRADSNEILPLWIMNNYIQENQTNLHIMIINAYYYQTVFWDRSRVLSHNRVWVGKAWPSRLYDCNSQHPLLLVVLAGADGNWIPTRKTTHCQAYSRYVFIDWCRNYLLGLATDQPMWPAYVFNSSLICRNQHIMLFFAWRYP